MSALERRDLNTDAWAHLKADIAARIAQLHTENESLTLDHDKTQALRGRIAELRKLLALEEAPVAEPDRPLPGRRGRSEARNGH